MRREAPEYEIRPFAEVDGGPQCAWNDDRIRRRMQAKGWLYTDLSVVYGAAPAAAQLWVRVYDGDKPILLMKGPWPDRTPPRERFAAAFAGLKRQKGDVGMLLGGLAGRFVRKDQLSAGSIQLCERGQLIYECVKETAAWQDRVLAAAACYAGVDEAFDELLVEGPGSGPGGSGGCERIDRPAAAPDPRERCLCGALSQSKGVHAKPGRRQLQITHEAPDIKGRPRPTLRVIETGTALGLDVDWHREDDKTDPVLRLYGGDLDAARAPLARCAPSPVPVIADLAITPTGHVSNVAIRGSANDPACLIRALRTAALGCREREAPAQLRLLITWYTPPLGWRGDAAAR